MAKDVAVTPFLVTVPVVKFDEVEYWTLYVVASAAAAQLNVGVLLTLVDPLAGISNRGTAGGGVKLDCNNLLAVPAGRPVMSPVAALFFKAASICAVVVPILFSRYNAATPATCGLAMDVPEIVLMALLLVIHADVIELPGAKISTTEPKLEKEERASVEVVEPTVMASAVLAGE
jgi:hypothetical protein